MQHLLLLQLLVSLVKNLQACELIHSIYKIIYKDDVLKTDKLTTINISKKFIGYEKLSVSLFMR
jgi:hypothetical protein